MERSNNVPPYNVLDWGHAPFAVEDVPGRDQIIFSDGFTLEFEGKTNKWMLFVRIVNRIPEYRCSSIDDENSSDWHRSYAVAFKEANELAGSDDHEGSFIMGIKHPLLQDGIRSRFGGSAVRKSLKRVTWGDQDEAMIGTSDAGELGAFPLYGGWGLTLTKLIPNRFEVCFMENGAQREALRKRKRPKLPSSVVQSKLENIANKHSLTGFRSPCFDDQEEEEEEFEIENNPYATSQSWFHFGEESEDRALSPSEEELPSASTSLVANYDPYVADDQRSPVWDESFTVSSESTPVSILEQSINNNELVAVDGSADNNNKRIKLEDFPTLSSNYEMNDDVLDAWSEYPTLEDEVKSFDDWLLQDAEMI